MKLQRPDNVFENCGFASISHINHDRHLGPYQVSIKELFFENIERLLPVPKAETQVFDGSSKLLCSAYL